MFARFRDDSFYSPGSVVTPGVDAPLNQSPSRTLTLSDGRLLSWCETGHRHGFPLIYFHSQTGSRLEAELLHDAALAAGIRVIAVDRPGIGASSFKKMRGHSDFAPDIVELLGFLDIDRAGLMGWDGGAAFALAFSHAHPQQVAFVTLLAPVAGRQRKNRRSGLGMLAAAVKLFVQARHRLRGARIEQCMSRLRESLCYADRKQFDNPLVYRLLVRDAAEAVRQGGRGVAQDSMLSLDDWDFDAASITVPVDVWRGGADTLSAVCHARLLQDTLPNVALHSIAGQGHFFFAGSSAGSCHGSGADIFRHARSALRAF
ncbi:alpha/beta hydrolase [Pseudohongiella acticola]|mgnify:CR=1 FL=1|jgi:pimeloyl-ACP methyl ester carboxylesterase|uniref:alpha/beta fold hydrolase n=1 Tax=Pseudohongiella acticola TaxID=1524254 RepID=UPI0030ECCF6F